MVQPRRIDPETVDGHLSPNFRPQKTESRPTVGKRSRITRMSSRALSPAGEILAEEIYARALSLMAIDDEITTKEAIDLAAIQCGIIPPPQITMKQERED
jgi:hypothetical protein